MLVSSTTTCVVFAAGGVLPICMPEPQPARDAPKIAMAKSAGKELNALLGDTNAMHVSIVVPPLQDSRAYVTGNL